MINLLRRTVNVCIWVLPAIAIAQTYQIKADIARTEASFKDVRAEIKKREGSIEINQYTHAVLAAPNRLIELANKHLPGFQVADEQKILTPYELSERDKTSQQSEQPVIAFFTPE